MGPGLQVAVVAAALCAVLLALLAAVLLSAARRRRALDTELSEARDQIGLLQDRVDDLARQVRRPAPAPDSGADGPGYVITTAGRPDPVAAPAPRTDVEPLTARQFASVATGESLVRLVSLGYGVRRALSAENRNRITFEMRRAVRRSRKERKRELRLVRRGLRAGETPAAGRDSAA